MIILDELDRPDDGARTTVVACARHGDGRRAIAALAMLSAVLHEIGAAAEAAREPLARMRIEAPVAAEAVRLDRITRTPPPFANPAKLARTERRRGRPGRK